LRWRRTVEAPSPFEDAKALLPLKEVVALAPLGKTEAPTTLVEG
jgi:hypothetical protein